MTFRLWRPILAGALLGLCGVRLGAEGIAAVDLKDGRTLHNVRILSNEPDSIVVKADEGLIKVRKVDLPPPLAVQYPITAAPEQTYMPPFSLEEAKPPPPKPVPKPVAKPKAPEYPLLFRGCTVARFAPKAFQTALGSVEVVLRNDSDLPAEVLPRDLVGIAPDGSVHAGRFFATEPDVGASSVKRKESIPAHAEVKDYLILSSEALTIIDLHWAKQPK